MLSRTSIVARCWRASIDASDDAANDRRVRGTRRHRDHQNHTFDETRMVMNSLVGQRLWKWQLVARLLTIILGAIVLAWPGPAILGASTLFGIHLPCGFCQSRTRERRNRRFSAGDASNPVLCSGDGSC